LKVSCFLVKGEGVSTYGLLAATSEPKWGAAFLCPGLTPRNCRRQTLSQALSNPTAREMLLHYVQVYLALSRRKFKFDVFKVQVSAAQICKFDFKI